MRKLFLLVVLCCSVMGLSRAQESTYVDVTKHGVRQGSRDASGALRNLIKSLGDQVHLYFPAGVYSFSDNIRITAQSVKIMGVGARITYPGRPTVNASDDPNMQTPRSGHFVIKADDVYVKGLHFDHTNVNFSKPPYGGLAGGALVVQKLTQGSQYSGDVLIEDVVVTNSTYTPIQVYEGSDYTKMSFNNVTLTNCSATGSAGMARIRGNHGNILIQNCTFETDPARAIVNQYWVTTFGIAVSREFAVTAPTVTRIEGCRGKFGGIYISNADVLEIYNTEMARWGYYPNGQTLGNSYIGGAALKIYQPAGQPGQIELDHFSTKETALSIYAPSLKLSGGVRDAMLYKCHFDAPVEPETTNGAYPMGVQFIDCNFFSNNTLMEGGIYTNCQFVAEAKSWESVSAFVSGAEFINTTLKNCTFAGMGLSLYPHQKVELENCKFTGYAGIVFQGGSATGELIFRDCSGGRFRSNNPLTDPNLKLRFIRVTDMRMDDATRSKIQSLPQSEMSSCNWLAYSTPPQ